MNIYTTDKIRNVVLLGHGGSGKTSLAEAFGYLSGITSRMGKVDDGNTLSDYSKEEQKRHFSISTSVIPIEWEGYKINIIDTPGYFDFVGEVEEAVSAAGAAIIVVNASKLAPRRHGSFAKNTSCPVSSMFPTWMWITLPSVR